MPTVSTTSTTTPVIAPSTPIPATAYVPIIFKLVFLGLIIFAVLSLDNVTTFTTRQKLNIIVLILIFYAFMEFLFAIQQCNQTPSGTSSDLLQNI